MYDNNQKQYHPLEMASPQCFHNNMGFTCPFIMQFPIEQKAP